MSNDIKPLTQAAVLAKVGEAKTKLDAQDASLALLLSSATGANSFDADLTEAKACMATMTKAKTMLA